MLARLVRGIDLPRIDANWRPLGDRAQTQSRRHVVAVRRSSMAEVALPLAVIFSTLLLVFGLAAALIDIDSYGWGLYLILVAVVGFIIIVAFCLVGTEQQTQPTIAKQVWSTTRQTIRRYTPMLPRTPLAMAELDPTVALALDQHSTQSRLSSTSLSAAGTKVVSRPSDHTDSQSRIEFDDGEDERGIHYV